MTETLPAPIAAEAADKTAIGRIEPTTIAAEAELSSADKAAVIIAALGPDVAPHVLGDMSDLTIRRFARSMSRLQSISPKTVERVIDDFTRELGAENDVRGGALEARRILRQLLDDDSVARIMDEVDESGRTLWERLSNCADQALAGFLRREHPQTAAVVLSKMRADKAARILEKLDAETAQIVVLRLARVPRLDREVMAILCDVISRDFLSVMRREQATRRPADVIGSLMNNVSTAKRAEFLKHLESEKPKLARQVLKVMFTFADLPSRVEPRDAPAIVKTVGDATLHQALKAAEHNAPRVLDFFLANVSKRLGERMRQEIEAMPEPTGRDGEAAQSAVVRAVRDLSQSGEITLVGSDSEED